MKQTVVLTGSSGFVGSALLVELSRNYRVIGVDRREPTQALRTAAPDAEFGTLDIADAQAVNALFKSKAGAVDFVIHLAAFYHFDRDKHPEYARTNILGTQNVIAASIAARVKRLVFASSLAALAITPSGLALTEKSPIGGVIPYAWSKAGGEALLTTAAENIPVAILRIGAVFSDWTELPFLWSLLKLWGGKSRLSKVMPGRGRSGFPYIHRDDLVRLIARVLERTESIGRLETFLASQNGAVFHRELFECIHAARGSNSAKPFHIPRLAARLGLHAQWTLGWVTGKRPYERPWMIDYVDKPMIADTSYTRKILEWDCTPELSLTRRVPVLYERFNTQRALWEERNERRSARLFEYP